jgi:hypothetical protein
MRIMVFLLVCALAFLSGQARADSVGLEWIAPASGPTPAGYRVYWGPSTGNYTTHSDVGNVLTGRTPELENGKWAYFAIKSMDGAGGLSGAFSNEAIAVPGLKVPAGARISSD